MTTRMTIGARFIPQCGPLTMTEGLTLSVRDRVVWRGPAAS
jgi:hypothetical protein